MKLFASALALVVSYAILASYVTLSYHELPARLATHFDLQGHPNGWMSRDGLVGFTFILGTFIPVFIIGVMAGVPWMIPGPGRPLAHTLLPYGFAYAAGNVLFFTGIHWLIVRANPPGQPPHLESMAMLPVVELFLFAMLLISASLAYHVARRR